MNWNELTPEDLLAKAEDATTKEAVRDLAEQIAELIGSPVERTVSLVHWHRSAVLDLRDTCPPIRLIEARDALVERTLDRIKEA